MLGLASLLSTPAAAQTRRIPPSVPKKHPDFDGDGYADLAIGAPYESVGTVTKAGAVHVVYGSKTGMAWPRNQLLHRPLTGPDGAASYDGYGAAVAWGDFNKDGYDDLVVGVPGAFGYIGRVYVYYGSKSGLDTTIHRDIWTRHYLRGTEHTGDRFGMMLAAGDFDGDGHADLAVVAAAEDSYGPSGVVHIIWGSTFGLTKTGNQMIAKDQAITSLAAADFNKDGFAELAVGLGGATVNDKWSAGAVHVHFGYRRGLDPWVTQLWTGDSAGILGRAANDDWFGMKIAAGDFNGDGFPDLAISAAGAGVSNAGKVHILYGSGLGLKALGNQIFYEGKATVVSLAAGDFNGDKCSDLAIGLPNATINGHVNAGHVHVLYGSRSRVKTSTSQLWSQDSPDILGGAEDDDWFGSTLVAADFNRSGHDDLAIGVPDENNQMGAVNVLFGSKTGLSSFNNAILMVGFQGLLGNAEAHEMFGAQNWFWWW